ncbi:PREDICTED: uncharacterized protein LOC108561279 isoform X1 [Nicrophorus vespilloides]|uniref:Uncharacterized protein LOC108561279 isoform X1 n=1 Tax=Nicrophorus vespilloides TaxID=110193 RepID=A0ABM1MJ79_NICVS|nr:PREDICTED: uncharacterized protein LOC108561279 isoform X1 [Nicrophorus vespilloides]
MHGSAGLHSAMAIKRQRRLREQAKKKALEQRERRLSSRTSSLDSVEQQHPKKVLHAAPPDHKLATSIGMLHIGVCFLVFGMFLIGSGLLPDDMVTWRGGGWWNELVATGLFVIALGVFLISLNRVMSKREEDNLNDYVQRQLTRSRSGHRLERDLETGCLATKNTRRILEKKREDKERGFEEILPIVHSPKIVQNGDLPLEKILEEDVEIRHDGVRETMSTTTTASLSPGTPSETRELISNGKHSCLAKPY